MAALSKLRDAFPARNSHIFPIRRQLLHDGDGIAARGEQPVPGSASAVSITPAEDIERRNSTGHEAVPRETPGLDMGAYSGVATLTHA